MRNHVDWCAYCGHIAVFGGDDTCEECGGTYGDSYEEIAKKKEEKNNGKNEDTD